MCVLTDISYDSHLVSCFLERLVHEVRQKCRSIEGK